MTLTELLLQSSALHRHLCPRQVLGARMGIWAGELLRLELPQTEKRLLTIVETDGCFADGVSVATNCWTGRRTLRVEDYGKVAATFIDTLTGLAWRISPHPGARLAAAAYAPPDVSRWESMLQGYQVMPVAELLVAEPVLLQLSVESLLSHAGARAVCAECGEEIVNERELHVAGRVLCRPCALGGYYRAAAGVAATGVTGTGATGKGATGKGATGTGATATGATATLAAGAGQGDRQPAALTPPAQGA